MLDKLKEEVYRANLELVKRGLVILTFGNASAVDRSAGVMIIKPSGISYEDMTPGDMVITDLEGNILEGTLRPSTDAPTHLAIYNAFPGTGGVVHTHSVFATAWAQAGKEIPCLGTTHADYFYGSVPVTRRLTAVETENDYEYNTGQVIADRFKGTDPMKIPAVLVNSHGPFTWGATVSEAVMNSVILEEVARMGAITRGIGEPGEIDRHLLDRHYLRKHGKGSYYGQK